MRKSIFLCLLIFLFMVSHVSGGGEERERAQGGMGKSLIGLEEGVRGAVSGFFGIGEHLAKFLFYGTRDGLRSFGRRAKKTDQHIQEKLW